jgi:glycosyltransferase involved in cell wall biosynthesis
MKIAQVAPLVESVPPRLYGGTERVVSYLTEELVRQGHGVTLFASGDSQTAAKLVRCCDVALRLNPNICDPTPYHVLMLEDVRKEADQFDILHFHVDFLPALLARDVGDRMLTTLHGRLDSPSLIPFYTSFRNLPLVSISHDQRRYLRDANWIGTIHHGLPRDLLPFQPRSAGTYLAFLGRISPEKRPDLAIEIALRAGIPLKIAAKIDRVDQEYWDAKIQPLVAANRNIEFLGEINEYEKAEFLGDALGLVFSVDWPEPFGLAMIEAMACGTPVIAFPRGSVPEVISEGVSGFVVDSMEDAVAAVARLASLDRAGVRGEFERHFLAERMTRDYVSLYEKVLTGRRIDACAGQGRAVTAQRTPVDPRAIVVGRNSRRTLDAVPFGDTTPGKETHARPATRSPARRAGRASEQYEGLPRSQMADSRDGEDPA